MGSDDGLQARAVVAELHRRLALGTLAGKRPGREQGLRRGIEKARVRRPGERFHLGRIALHAHIGGLRQPPDVNVVFLRAGGDEFAVGAPAQRHVAAAPGKAARRYGEVAEAPYGGAIIVRGGDPAAILAEVEIGHRARVRADLVNAVVLYDDRVLADRGSDGAICLMRDHSVDPFALEARELDRRAIGSDTQDTPVIAAAYEPVAGRVANQRQYRATVNRWCGIGRRRREVGW